MATPTTTIEQTTAATEHADVEATGLAALGVDGPFLLAQVVNFLILFFLLRWVLYRPILDVLVKRRTTIEHGLKAAEEAERRAASTQQETAKLLGEARAEASSIVEDAKAQATAVATKLKDEASAQSEALLERTRAALAAEKDAVLAEAQKELTDLVLLATERVVADQKVSVSADTVAAAIKSVKRPA